VTAGKSLKAADKQVLEKVMASIGTLDFESALEAGHALSAKVRCNVFSAPVDTKD
jgi:hypothetical protein